MMSSFYRNVFWLLLYKLKEDNYSGQKQLLRKINLRIHYQKVFFAKTIIIGLFLSNIDWRGEIGECDTCP